MSEPREERSSGAWSGERAERHLRSLELFGMRFGLDRMHRMMTVLDSPQRRFRSIHVVGTNGKSSTTRMTAAILERHGLRTGAYLSPHLMAYTERVRVAERDISMSAFAAAVARAAWAAERVNRTLADDDHVTQFELLTAAAFWAMAEQEVDVAVVEAGLGGRYDATSVVESDVTVLTNVGLEHTRWLGPTRAHIAAEKLAVLRPDTALVLGARLDEEVLALARALADERHARLVRVEDVGEGLGEGPIGSASTAGVVGSAEVADSGGVVGSAGAVGSAGVAGFTPPAMLARGNFQRLNFSLGRAAAATYLEALGIELREEAVAEAAATTTVPGRMHVLSEDPLTVLDGAHNPDAVNALIESLPRLVEGRPLGLVLGVLEDKDAASMLAALLPHCARVWFTAPPSSRALSPATLQSLARQLGFSEVLSEPQPTKALTAAQDWARASGGVVLAAGSVYLVGDLLAHDSQPAASAKTHEAARRAEL